MGYREPNQGMRVGFGVDLLRKFCNFYIRIKEKARYDKSENLELLEIYRYFE
jgi:hypothetical protein